MKNKIITLLVVGNILMVGNYGFAQTEPVKAQVIDAAQAQADIASKKAIDVGNKTCPVSNELVVKNDMKDAKPMIMEYNGKIYHLCCPMCVKDFKKHPEKYSKIAEDEVKAEKKQ
jgi:YHS domain-containing protein